MDFAEASSKIGGRTKTAREFSAERINQASAAVNDGLDAAAPRFASFAARWDAEADRRKQLRTEKNLKALMDAQRAHNSARSTAASAKAQREAAKKSSKNPFGAARRSARTADKAARSYRSSAKVSLKEARRNYPATLASVAVRVHAGHSVPAAVASYAMSTEQDWTMWPASTSAALIAANAAALWLGRRKSSAKVEDGASAEERLLLERLDPSYWVQHAPDRGLSGTVTTPPALEAGGIRCEIRLDGTWTVKTLSDKADSVRALLGARTGLRMRITAASRGGWAVLTLATRSAAASVSSLWTPERIPADPLLMSLGLDTETGDEVLVPFDERLLVSGASGTGKSWSSRPLLATAHLRGDLLFIDGKGEEANIWEAVCRVAVEPAEIAAAIDEAWAEMDRRRREMKRRGISVWDGRQLTVQIDEGQVVLATLKLDKSDEGKARMQRLRELSSLGRSRGVVLWWATQYPVTDGSAPGVDQLVAPNLLTRFSLRVAGTTQAQVALDDCAHYAPHQIPEGREYRGHGYLKGYGPRLLRTWTLDDDGVRNLPKSFWRGSGSAPAEPVERTPLRLLKDTTEAPASAPAAPVTNRDKVAGAVADGACTVAAVAKATGLNKGTVSQNLTALVEQGAVKRAADGSLTVGEVSA